MEFLIQLASMIYLILGTILFGIMFIIWICSILFSISSLYTLFRLIFLGKYPKIDESAELLCVRYKKLTDVIVIISMVVVFIVLGFCVLYRLLDAHSLLPWQV